MSAKSAVRETAGAFKAADLAPASVFEAREQLARAPDDDPTLTE
jgi:hypothetical protein